MAADDVTGEAVFDSILDRVLAGTVDDVDEVIAATAGLTPEQRDELRALGRAFRRGTRSAEPDPDEPPFRNVGGFRLLRRLGGGGAGVVWLARQSGLDRSVALKLLRPGLLSSREAAARFEREGRVLAQLRHPGIVAVIDSGSERGVPWIAMEYVAGDGLDEIHVPASDDATRPTIIQAVGWCRDVARALACAHEAGILHRDVKPSNIRITYEGRAVLVDFGLAWVAGAETLTDTGWFRGTPRYAAPEQVSSKGARIDGRADVYSLGVTLYEIVTGRAPYSGDTPEQLFARILAGDPEPPRRVRGDIPRELETVILTAMDRDPSRRYPTAEAFADDLDALLQLRDILARPPSLRHRLARAVRRRPATWLAASGLVVLWTVVAFTSHVRAVTDRDAGLAEARDRLASYRQIRDRAVTLELEAARLDEQAGLRALNAEERAQHSAGDIAARATRLEAERQFQAAFDRAEAVLDANPGFTPARDLLASLGFERWCEARHSGDSRGVVFWESRVRAYDGAGRFRHELEGVTPVVFVVDAPGARIEFFRWREDGELTPGGSRRFVLEPRCQTPLPVALGHWCLRVVEPKGELVIDDLVLDLDGHPIEGTCFVDDARPPLQHRDVLVSIDGSVIRDPAEYQILVVRGAKGAHAVVVDRDGGRNELQILDFAQAQLAVARPDVIASDGGQHARVWHDGSVRDVRLPAGAGYRITATPAFSSAASRVESGDSVGLADGSWLAIVRAPGRETERIPFVVSRPDPVVRSVSLRLRGATPAGFVHVPAGEYRRRAGPSAGGTIDRAGESVGGFSIMEREVLVGEFLQFLNDPKTPEVTRERATFRTTKHGTHAGSIWSRVSRAPDGRLKAGPIEQILPVNGVSFVDAVAYAAWRTDRAREAGRKLVFDVPTAGELMRAAMGSDGRAYAYGSWFSPGWQKTAGSRSFIFSEPPTSFPTDESPFGVFDLTGSVSEWCRSGGAAGGNDARQCIFGGAFTQFSVAPLTSLTSFESDAADPTFGFRLVVRDAASESR